MIERRGLLVMAYGTPRGLDDVEAYYTDIRRGRPPSSEQLAELTERYRAIGGSPLLEITEAQARGLERRTGVKAFLGMKHAAPFISDGVQAIADDRVERAVGLVLAPHYSKMSIGDYAARARRAAADIGWGGSLEVIESWHLEGGYIDWLADAVRNALRELSSAARTNPCVVFSAHSLPTRAVQAGDPYPEQLRETAEAVAAAAGIERWAVGWQSAGRTGDQWLGPDIGEVISDLAAEGSSGVVVCACGFVADHLEILYDVDIEARAVAEKAGIEFARTAMPNDDTRFLDTLAGVVGRAFRY
jgi:ferrochelatase